MKFFAIAALALSFQAVAGYTETMRDMEKMPFDQHKRTMQDMVEKRATMVQESKACVDAAENNAALKECHIKMREEKQAMMDSSHHEKSMIKKK